MRVSRILTCFAFVAFNLVLCQSVKAQTSADKTVQDASVSIEQDERLTRLIEMKKKINKKDEKRYRIQIYNGTLKDAQEALKEFRKAFEDLPSDITFETPNYKVRVGKFRNRLEADRYLLEVKKEFPSAFLLKP
ncbi:SPOR domain-containing protein [Robertkochia aurantiaca]|uniref:SPOR domain-containing protein n=1 Tax=Robertkochia aurantiaca TaxID=2873700 RepID=UPI001CCAA265|nr:SPOR domain-containing protein [Robertkochia sp. 3YJGBD-33]